jgi:ketosteroid isomerase-like protein
VRWAPWIPLAAVVLHVFEEFVWPGGFTAWYHAYRPDVARTVTPRFMIVVNAILIVLAVLAGVIGVTPRGIVIWLTIAAVVGINGVWHLQATLRGRRYSPGVVTGALLYLPIMVGGYSFFIRSGRISNAGAGLAAAQGAAYWVFSEGRKFLRARSSLGVIALALALAAPPPQVRAEPVSHESFRTVLLSLYGAVARGDTAAVSARLTDDAVWVVGANGGELTKSQLLAAASHTQVPPPRFELDSVRAERNGEFAIVEYSRSDHRSVGRQDATTRSRALDVFVWRGSEWLLKHHTQTWLVTPSTGVALDSTTQIAYVGRYQIAPGYVDNVHWERGRLFATASGQTRGAELIPVSSSAFRPDGVGALVVFERDATGRVLGYVQGFPDGLIFRATRLP